MRVATARLPSWPEAPHYPVRRWRLGQTLPSAPGSWGPGPPSTPLVAPTLVAASSSILPVLLGAGALGLLLVGASDRVHTPRRKAGLAIGTVLLAGGAAWWVFGQSGGLATAAIAHATVPMLPVATSSGQHVISTAPGTGAASPEVRFPPDRLSVHLIVPPAGSTTFPGYLAVVLPQTAAAASSSGLSAGPGAAAMSPQVGMTPLDGPTLAATARSLGISLTPSTFLSWIGAAAAKLLSLVGQAAASTGVGLGFSVASSIVEGTTTSYGHAIGTTIGALLGVLGGPLGVALGAFLGGKLGAVIGHAFSTPAEQVAMGHLLQPVTEAEAVAFTARVNEITAYQEALVTDPMLAESMVARNPALAATVEAPPAPAAPRTTAQMAAAASVGNQSPGTTVTFADGSTATSMGGGFTLNSDGTISNALGEVTGSATRVTPAPESVPPPEPAPEAAPEAAPPPEAAPVPAPEPAPKTIVGYATVGVWPGAVTATPGQCAAYITSHGGRGDCRAVFSDGSYGPLLPPPPGPQSP